MLNREFDKLLNRINLHYDENRPPGWNQNINSRGEGMILMRNGHLFVLKEKNPPLLIEYGPRGDSPEGLTPELVVSSSNSFPLPAVFDVTFYPLQSWEFSERALRNFTDFSDMAVGPDNRIYLLSEESRTIGKIEGRLRPSESKIDIRKVYHLPRKIKSAEGLVIGPDLVPYVGSDLKNYNKPNLYKLDAL